MNTEEVYVHDKVGHIQFNARILVFMRSWHMPTDANETPMPDSWLRIAAFCSPGPAGRSHYVCVNSHVDMVANVVIADTDGSVLKLGRAKPDKKLQIGLLESIRSEAIDIPEWEYQNQKAWPYQKMFDKELVRQRYVKVHGENAGPYFDVAATNRNFDLVRKTTMPTPCRTCGKQRVVRVRP